MVGGPSYQTLYYDDYQFKVGEMDQVCGTWNRDNKCIQKFPQKTWREENILKYWGKRWEYNIKIDHIWIGSEGMDQIYLA